jgi:uncharacterized protein (TIGR02466 family)
MELMELFPTPIWVGKLDNIDNTLIENFCLDLYNKNPDRRDNNGYRKDPTGLKWRSWYLIKTEYDACPELYKLVNSIETYANECFQKFNPNKTTSLRFSNSWINISGPGQYVAPHIHPTSCLLATYYIKTPARCGNIIFMNPNPAITWNYPSGSYRVRNNYTDQLRSIDVGVGKFVLAPAHAQHYVEPNDSDENRISIVLNFVIRDTNPLLSNDRNYSKNSVNVGM